MTAVMVAGRCPDPRRWLPLLAATAVVIGAVAAFALREAGGYTLHARFTNAGQLVKGSAVRIAGRQVGTVTKLRLTDTGQVDATLELRGGEGPLPTGTHAAIRATGQAGLANRYVELDPGPAGARPLADGAVLTPRWTRGIVDLDQLFTTLDPATRAQLRGLIGRSSELFAGSGGRTFNTMLRRLNPAMLAITDVTGELGGDDHALATLVRDSATAASALARRSGALEGSVEHSAAALNALADRREALAQVLVRAPGTLNRATRTLRHVDATVARVRPALRDVVPAAAPLRDVLRQLAATLPRLRPVLRQLRGQLPDTRASLTGLARLAAPAARALGSLQVALTASAPIIRGLRIYGADFVLGVTNGLAGIITSNYNRVGHYGRLNFVENPQTLLAGIPASILSKQALVPGLLSTRTGVTALCPGGNQPPAPDGSNRVVVDRSLCDPSQSIPASVNGG